MFSICFLIVSSLLFCSVNCDNERKLSVQLNPKCTLANNCNDITVVYIKSQAENDTIHYIWDFTGTPGILIAKTDLNTTMDIDWNTFMNITENSILFSTQPRYVFSALLHRVYLFDDPNDKANIADASISNVISLNPHEFDWARENLTEYENSVVLLMKAKVNKSNDSSISMKFKAYADTDHDDELPHLYHSSQSMQIDLVARNLSSNFTSPRVAVEFFIVSAEPKSEGSFKFHKKRNLDDEFTPGIFDVFDIVSPRSFNDSRGAFIQYRPVSYTTKDRTVSGSTELKQGDIVNLINTTRDVQEKFNYSLTYAYYGYDIMDKVAQGMNITFGLNGDGFYSRTNYTSFSMLVGIGGSPVESLSPFVITFAAIGLGVPLLVLVIGGVYVAMKRYR